MERTTGIEPATLALARRCSTAEPRPQNIIEVKMAEPTGFEPAISCVTGRHVNPYTTVPDHKVKKLRGQDLNLRPSGYEPDELPSCSTPR